MSTPDLIEIQPAAPFDARVRIPGSKSLTNRALLLAALAEGTSRLSGVLFSDDSRRMLEALEKLGFEFGVDEAARRVTVHGGGGQIPARHAELHLGNAGTAYRFLTAACGLGTGAYDLDGIPRMRQRPIGELVDALRRLGAQIDYLGKKGCPPLRVHGMPLEGGELTMAPTLSSQYLSAMLQVAPYTQRGITMRFQGPVTSWPYVRMTLDLMRRFGVEAEVDDALTQIRIEPGRYHAAEYDIEPDASNASYFLAAAVVVPGSRCVIEGLGRLSLQGDVGFADVLRQMGAQVEFTDTTITAAAPANGAPLRGVNVDLNAMPDMAQTLGAVALFARGPTTIRNVGNLRVKETDRIAAVQTELTKLGATVRVRGDDLHIEPPADGQIRPAAIETYDDHRMAMSFAVVGLGAPGVTILDPGCVAKTYPTFFDDLARLRPGSTGTQP